MYIWSKSTTYDIEHATRSCITTSQGSLTIGLWNQSRGVRSTLGETDTQLMNMNAFASSRMRDQYTWESQSVRTPTQHALLDSDGISNTSCIFVVDRTAQANISTAPNVRHPHQYAYANTHPRCTYDPLARGSRALRANCGLAATT